MSIVDQLGLKNLKVFEALMRERNASRVAEQMGLTQQAISDQLKKMRDVFDDPLFIRKPNGFVPTPVAERLNVKIQKILLDLEGLTAQDTFEPATASGAFVIAATDYAQIIVLPEIIERIRRDAPNLQIIIRDIDSERVADMMQFGQVDLLIAFPDVVPKTHPSKVLFKEQYVCVASKSNPFADASIDIAELARHPQIAASRTRLTNRDSIDDWFDLHGLTRNVVISAPCFSLVPDYINRTDAIAFLPSRSVPNDSLAILALENGPEGFDVVVAWHARSNKDPLHNWLLELIEEQRGAKTSLSENLP